MPNRRLAVASATFAVAIAASVASPLAASEPVVINTGGETGAYHSQFCPVLAEKLEAEGFGATCRTSDGTAENMQRIADNPSQLAYGQLDVLTLKAKAYGGADRFRKLRMDDVRECVFAVTRSPAIDNYGVVAVRADELRIILPPERSGSAATFRYLQSIDPYGIGRANDVIHAASTDEAIRIALSDEKSVALFVQFPDPDNPRFKLVQEKGGHIVPVIDRTILDQRVDGVPVYFAQETQVENAGWLKSGTRVVTACTPLVVFTGTTGRIADEAQRSVHERLAGVVGRLRGDELLPRQGIVARVLKRTRELTATGAEKFVEISEDAREKAAPLFQKAREAARQAVQGGHSEPAAGDGAPRNEGSAGETAPDRDGAK